LKRVRWEINYPKEVQALGHNRDPFVQTDGLAAIYGWLWGWARALAAAGMDGTGPSATTLPGRGSGVVEPQGWPPRAVSAFAA